MTPAIVLVVVAAGGVGAVLRYLLSRAFASPNRSIRGESRDFPWGVLVVNVIGSALGGSVLGLAANGNLDAGIQLVLLTGLCGGLTTFSTWSVETIQFVQEGKWRVAALSVGANLVLGVAAAAVGYLLASAA